MPLKKIVVAPAERRAQTALVRKHTKKLKGEHKGKDMSHKQLARPSMQVQEGISRSLNTAAHLQARMAC